MRILLPAGRAAGLTLADGIALARRAGAGNLVMGDFFRVASGARLVANVFDVASGDRIRTITALAPAADSLLAAFGPLARGVLAVPSPANARTGDFGTARLDAYQAYLRDVQFKNRFRLAESERELRAALRLDSTFALARAALANVLAFGEVEASKGERLQHALAAQRLGANLPTRDRALIAAGVAWARGDYLAMCNAAGPLVGADSTDTYFGLTVAERTARRAQQSRERPDSISLLIARRIAEQWVADDRDGSASRQGLAEVMALQGQTAADYAVLRHGPLDVGPGNNSNATVRGHIDLAFARTARFRRAIWLGLEPMVETNGLDRPLLERYASGLPRMYLSLPVDGLAAAEFKPDIERLRAVRARVAAR